MSREAPPPLPGGYKLGDKVFYTGSSKTLPGGDKLVHGQQGEVGGPATLENYKGKGVSVLFPGNKRGIECRLRKVRRLAAASTAAPPCPLCLHLTRNAAQALCVPTTASAAAPSPHAFGGRGRGAGWPLRYIPAPAAPTRCG